MMMMMKFMFLFLVLLISTSKMAAAFDLYKLALQWPAGFCNNKDCRALQFQPAFTVHGLWPSNEYPLPDPTPTGIPTWSSQDVHANVINRNSIVPTLISDMYRYWPQLYRQQSEWDFWTHEWNKHGLLLTAMSPGEYFQATLSIFSIHGDPLNSLIAGGVVPSNTHYYKASEIQSWAGDYPILACYPTSVFNQFVLYEIRFCFDATNLLVRQPCNGPPDSLGTCGGEYGDVWFYEW
ncbi:Ribonuclease S-7 [Linum perenne]